MFRDSITHPSSRITFSDPMPVGTPLISQVVVSTSSRPIFFPAAVSLPEAEAQISYERPIGPVTLMAQPQRTLAMPKPGKHSGLTSLHPSSTQTQLPLAKATSRPSAGIGLSSLSSSSQQPSV